MDQLSQACDIERIAAITRASTYVISCLGGVLSIYLGYRLYTHGVTSAVGGNVKNRGWSVALRAAGPGVFLSLFGMAILIYALDNPLIFRAEVSERAESSTQILPATPSPVPVPQKQVPKEPPPRQALVAPTPPPAKPTPARQEKIEISFFDGGPLTKPRVQAASTVALGLIQNESQKPNLTDEELRRLEQASETITALRDQAQ